MSTLDNLIPQFSKAFLECISFLLLLKQMTINLVASNNMSLLSYSSVGQKSEVCFLGLKPRYLQDWFLLDALGKNLLLAFF